MQTQAKTSWVRPLAERALAELQNALNRGAILIPYEKLEHYIHLIGEWNRRVDLTAARSPEELIDLTLADALVLALLEPGPQRWVDVGSGAGAPGLILALLRPDLEMTLVEPRDKRIAFLRIAAVELGCKNVQIQRGRSEQLTERSWDVAVSRATFKPAQWLAEGARLVSSSVWLLSAREPEPEVATLRRESTIEYTWPLTGAPRKASRYRVLPRISGS